MVSQIRLAAGRIFKFMMFLWAFSVQSTRPVRNALESYVASPAVLDAIDTCRVDNWGMPHQKRRPYHTTYVTDIQQACKATFKNDMRPMAHVLDNATVNHYMSNKDYDNFKGIDMVPDNHHLYNAGGIWGHSLEYKHVRRDYMKAATCENELDDGSTWTVTRVGPFKTKGGYDWVQLGWDNLWDTKGKLEKHPHGIYVLEQFSGPVTADGTRLGHPPIHVHHIHVGPTPGVRQRSDAVGCVFGGKTCYDPTRIFEHHGDYQCTSVPDGPDSTVSGGLDCLTESVPDGYGKLITHPLGLEGDLNDARAPNSTVLEWYYQLAARWVPKLECSEYPQPTDDDQTDKKTPEHTVPESAPATASSADNAAATAQTPAAAGEASQAQQRKMKNKVPSAVYPRPKAMSFHNCAGPGDLNTKQSSFVFTYQSPTDVESIFWYTGRMHHSGSMLRMKQHAHNAIFKESIVFAASPEQLGLTKANGLYPDQPYQVVRTRDAGYANNVEVKRFILDALKKSRERYDADQVYSNHRSLRAALGTTSDYVIADNGPRAICHAVESTELVDGYRYDRREPTCCVPWEFTQGDIFTVVGFNKIVTEKGTGAHQGDHPFVPATLPGHIGWWLSFDTHEVPEKSHYSLIQYTNNPDVQYQDFTNMHEDRIMFMLNGGTSFDPGSWQYQLFRSCVYVYHHPILLPLMVVCMVLMARAFMYLRKVFAFVTSDGDIELSKGVYQHIAQD